jgi:hypothetical protein
MQLPLAGQEMSLMAISVPVLFRLGDVLTPPSQPAPLELCPRPDLIDG